MTQLCKSPENLKQLSQHKLLLHEIGIRLKTRQDKFCRGRSILKNCLKRAL